MMSSVIDSSNTLSSIAIPLVIVLPLLSFLMSFFISDKYSWLVSFVSPLLLLISAVASIVVLIDTWNTEPLRMHWDWFSVGGQIIPISLLVDNLTVLMLCIVTVVSFLVHLYSIGYMAGDSDLQRYFGMLGFFTFSMIGIVFSGSLLLVFVFWELVGFSSYMLIGHWNEKPEAANASKRAFIFNRVGDAGFVIGLMIVWTAHGTFDFSELSALEYNTSWDTWAALGIFCGVIGKSAQFPLFAWLPDAMEGPTPVSALIHAATMVAAGVFLLARIFFMLTPDALDVIAITGCVTAIAGSLAALAQHDMKRVLAYSTISQLGLMVLAVGTGNPVGAVLHLTTHAFFKACLFLSAGSVIHTLHQAGHQLHATIDVQDVRNLGGLRKKLPLTFMSFAFSGASLAGIPMFSGFVSKDAILDGLIGWSGDGASWKWLLVACAFAVSFITVLYTFRLIWRIFMGEPNSPLVDLVHEAPPVMKAPLFILSTCSVWLIVTGNPFSYEGWIFTGLSHDVATHRGYWLAIVSGAWVIIALLTGYLLRNASLSANTLHRGFYLDKFFRIAVERPTFQFASITTAADAKWIDGALHSIAYGQLIVAHFVGWVDRAIIDGMTKVLATLVREVGSFSRSFIKGNVQHYIFWAALGIIIFIIWSLL